ncbi:DUF6243 family protein [Streptomyces sp. NBC_01216]|uniref:DUF6243 family protein n=1 Tax=unclassified Streptomyces TaxID=2593676 RepID=UPI002E0EDB10|nr:DUF6243 family protein [Streptomyces sp. NBC_01216]
MAKGRNNLLGVGGQRRKPSRGDAQGGVESRDADRKAAVDQKRELLRKMRERAQDSAGAVPAGDTGAVDGTPADARETA